MWLVINNQSALFQYSLVKVQWNSTSPQASTCSNLGSWANLIWLVIVSRIDRKKKTKNSKRLAIDSKADALNILLSQNRATLGHKLQHWGQSCCSSRSLYFRTPKVCRLCPRKRQSWRCHRSRSSWGTPIWRNGGGLCKNRPRAKYPNVGRKILPFLTLTLPPSSPLWSHVRWTLNREMNKYPQLPYFPLTWLQRVWGESWAQRGMTRHRSTERQVFQISQVQHNHPLVAFNSSCQTYNHHQHRHPLSQNRRFLKKSGSLGKFFGSLSFTQLWIYLSLWHVTYIAVALICDSPSSYTVELQKCNSHSKGRLK